MKLSTVICTYNGQSFVEEQIASILSQTVPIDEIIICDDGSTDATLELVVDCFEKEGFGNYRILPGGEHYGVAANFLRGMKAATGDYVFTSDQDDVWLEDKVGVFIDAIEDTHRDLYFSDGFVVDADLKHRPYSLWDSLHFSTGQLQNRSVFEVLLKQCIVTGAAMVVSRSLIGRIEEIPPCWLHDGWLAMAAAAEDSIQPINEKTFLYRQHGSNVVGAASESFAGRIHSWANNIGDQPRIRAERRDRYLAVRNLLAVESSELDECIGFWETLCSLDARGLRVGLSAVAKLAGSGAYRKYYTGPRGALRDALWVLGVQRKPHVGGDYV